MGFYDCRCMVTGVSLKGADAALNGRPGVFALIARTVCDRLAKSDTAAHASPEAMFQQLFDGVPVTEGIYGGNLKAVSKHLREMSAVSNFLTGRRIAWKPA